MKAIFFSVLMICTLSCISQDISRLISIDSAVHVINYTNFRQESDSLFQHHPQLGLSIKTYITASIENEKLKKYYTKTLMKDTAKGDVTSFMSLYFHENELIKVEESIIVGPNKLDFHWYFFQNKPFYYTLTDEKAEDRAAFLLNMAQGILSKFQNPIQKK